MMMRPSAISLLLLLLLVFVRLLLVLLLLLLPLLLLAAPSSAVLYGRHAAAAANGDGPSCSGPENRRILPRMLHEAAELLRGGGVQSGQEVFGDATVHVDLPSRPWREKALYQLPGHGEQRGRVDHIDVGHCLEIMLPSAEDQLEFLYQSAIGNLPEGDAAQVEDLYVPCEAAFKFRLFREPDIDIFKGAPTPCTQHIVLDRRCCR
mmetsp:Transcript_115694/g.367888  ORF Transcript_115694/g.367888 Transcript_115694/m.367888 type:complete len:206 (-) Transcript_115694:1198-1815(-)